MKKVIIMFALAMGIVTANAQENVTVGTDNGSEQPTLTKEVYPQKEADGDLYHGLTKKLTFDRMVPPHGLEVTYDKTVHVIFPSEVRYVDLGSPDLIAGKADGAENVIRVKATVRNFPNETNMSVITEDGSFYTFNVKYASEPLLLNVEMCDFIHDGEKVNRPNNAVNLQVAGNGVGLMMVHRLVRLHGGRVRVTSTEGKGTMVCVIFPLRSRRLDKACPVASPRKQDTGETRMGPDCGPMREILPTMTGGDRQRILIVEDNDDLRTYLEGLLKEEYLVQTCSNGRDALLVAREYNPDLILSDVMMPEMGGDELCASVKSDIETSHIPVMLLTALGDEKDMLEGLENGADAYITKPFSINVLRANIRNILANRALLKRAYAGLEDGVGQVPPDCHNTRDWKFMASVRECVMKNIDNPGFCVDMLCGMQNMSRTGFFNKLKALTGHAPADYIRSMRLQYAAQLLREKDCSITEISDDSGFSDVRYFREVFRKYYGMSPSEYRNSMRG